MIMEQKHKYTAPAVLDDLALELEGEILKASVVDNIESVETTGQEVVTYDFSDPSNGLNHSWE